MNDKSTNEKVLEEINQQYNLMAIDTAQELQKSICTALNASGIMYRIFVRKKELSSIITKMNQKLEVKYIPNRQKMQDLIGIRIVLYFKDDIDACISILNSLFNIDNKEHDKPDPDIFRPQRINYVYKIPPEISCISQNQSDKCYIDSTFEVQIRTIFSEGWHEVEHDIRYKYEHFWFGEENLSREMNGLFAVLETCDNNICNICERLAYNSYKKQSWEPMIRNHFRLRISENKLSEEIISIMNKDTSLSKTILRFSRSSLIILFFKAKLPINCNNIIYIINANIDHPNASITNLTPDIVLRKLKNVQQD